MESPPRQLILTDNGQTVAEVSILYQLAKELVISMRTAQGLPSAHGGGWSERYKLCLGKAPPFYELDPATVNFAIKSKASSADHERNCNSFCLCYPGIKDDTNVCYEFKIQGHHKDGALGRNPENQTVYVDATLSASYHLKEPVPQFLSDSAIAELLKAAPAAKNN